VKKQLEVGSVNVLAMLNAEQTYLLAAVNRVQAEGNRLADVVGLFMALAATGKTRTSRIWRRTLLAKTRSRAGARPRAGG